MLPAASRVGFTTDILGEGPVWDDRDRCVYYVDIKRHLVYRLAGPDLTDRTVIHEADRAVTCVLLAEDGGYSLWSATAWSHAQSRACCA